MTSVVLVHERRLLVVGKYSLVEADTGDTHTRLAWSSGSGPEEKGR